jgi:hypothetical protein
VFLLVLFQNFTIFLLKYMPRAIPVFPNLLNIIIKIIMVGNFFDIKLFFKKAAGIMLFSAIAKFFGADNRKGPTISFSQWIVPGSEPRSIHKSVQMNHCADESRCKWIHVQMNPGADESMCRWIYVQMNPCADESMCRWIHDGSKSRWIHVKMNPCTEKSMCR